MRYLLMLLVLPVFALDLTSGKYSTIESHNDSVCPQDVKVELVDGMTLLKVAYIGDCFYQGPYTYYCFQNICTDGQIDYQITSPDSFTWVNRNYRIWGKFKKD